MTVSLITGSTGSGKTAHVVDMMLTEFKDRPIFQMGIRELTIPHDLVPPVAQWTEQRPAVEDPSLMEWWFTFPPNSVVIIDEAQKVFRPRAVGSKVPPEVQAFETHRHVGIDFVLLTQHPGLLDANVRKLVKRHRHINEHFLGRHMFEWPRVGDIESTADKALAAKTKYALPKHVFGKYKSAELHTKTKHKVPFYAYLFAACVLVFGVVGWRSYETIKEKVSPVAAAAPGQVAPQQAKPVALAFADKELPRIADFPHTAPKYDEVTKPVDAPWPAGCMIVGAWRGNKEKCRCVDQQGNNYATSDAVCRGIVKNGIFKDWGRSPPDGAQPQQASDRPPSGQRLASDRAEQGASGGPVPVSVVVDNSRAS